MRPIFFALLLSLALTGCRTVWDPTFMPASYKYQQEEYHTAPGAQHTWFDEAVDNIERKIEEEMEEFDREMERQRMNPTSTQRADYNE